MQSFGPNPVGFSPNTMITQNNSSIPGIDSFMIGGTRFDIPTDYQPIEYVNRGAYGVVCSALHKPTGTKVAIKKISNAFNNLEETKRLLREIKLLRHFRHENVLSVADIFSPQSQTNFDDIYLVTELMDTDLQLIINSEQVLSDQHIQYFLYQILCGVKYIHSANILHRDIKPSNILCNEDCTVKLADFGLARVQQNLEDMTEYVATRWYRAPEIILSWKEYTKAIDIWSVGCILAELMLRKPIFQGQDYIHQITRITDILGNPCEEDINMLNSDQARQFLRTMGFKPKIPWVSIFPNGNPLAFDLLDKMLAFNPRKRCTVEEALNHPYLEDMRDAEYEGSAEAIFSFDFEKWKMTKEIYQELIRQEIDYFHPRETRSPLPGALNMFQEAPLTPLGDTVFDNNEMSDIDWNVQPTSVSLFETPTANPFAEKGAPDFDKLFGENSGGMFD